MWNTIHSTATSIHDAINDAYLLSDLRKPSQIITKTDEDDQAQNKSNYKKLSPILFIRIQQSTGKKNRQTKNKLASQGSHQYWSQWINHFIQGSQRPTSKQ